MLRTVCFAAVALLAGSAIAADAKDEVKDAVKKLADAPNYSWKQTTEIGGGGGGGGGGRFRPGPTEGKSEKDGYSVITYSMQNNTMEAVVKDKKAVIKTEDGWQTLEEATADNGGGGQPNPARFLAFRLRNFKTPAQQAEDACSKVHELKKEGDAYEGELSEEAIKEMLPRRGRPGGEPPQISNAKGNVKVWLKDGVLSKAAFHITATVSTPNGDRDIDTTTTTEITDVGSTKVTVPEEAKKKLS